MVLISRFDEGQKSMFRKCLQIGNLHPKMKYLPSFVLISFFAFHCELYETAVLVLVVQSAVPDWQV